MGLRSLLSLGFIAVPIGATLGILLGLDAHRAATGQQPLFQDNSVSKEQYCQKAYGITPSSVGQQYTLNPNQWGWDGAEGNLCMNVTSFNNNTYSTPNTAPRFSVTWQYPQGPATQPVHAFPNIKIDGEGSLFPAAINAIKSIPVDVEWTYGLGTEIANTTDVTALGNAMVNANVAIDMFLDADMKKAQDPTTAQYEVMVWLCKIGSATQPIGYETRRTTAIVNGTTFGLYFGTNGLNQSVFTWVSEAPVEKFIGDIGPLLMQVPQLGIAGAPNADYYLGYMGLGSETLWTPQKVTFDVSYLSMDIKK